MKRAINVSDFYSAKAELLGTLLVGKGIRYRIPINQRPWSWKNSHLEQLLVDIISTRDKFFEKKKSGYKAVRRPTGNPHFLGALVFVDNEREEGALDVVDGQQRITSLSLIALVIKQYLEASLVAVRTRDKPKVRKSIRKLDSWLWMDRSESKPRLIVDKVYRPLWTELLLSKSPVYLREALQKESIELEEDDQLKDLYNSYNYISKYFEGLTKATSTKENVDNLSSLFTAMNEFFIILFSKVGSEQFSYEVFNSLNNNGLELSSADNIKNHLYIYSDPSDHADLRDNWDVVLRNAPDHDVERFLRMRYIALYGSCAKKDLFETIHNNELKGKGNLKTLVRKWAADAKKFKKIAKIENLVSSDKKASLCVAGDLNLSLLWIIYFGASNKLGLSDKEFKKIIVLANKFAFRFRTIGQGSIEELERILGEASRCIQVGKGSRTVRKIFQGESPDKKFLKDFRERESITVAKQQYYILNEIERHLAKDAGLGLAPYPHSKKQHIEHIMPKNPERSGTRGKEWRHIFLKKAVPRKDFLNKLGNLCILEAGINGSGGVSNYGFGNKKRGTYPKGAQTVSGGVARKCYKDSQLFLVKQLLRVRTDKWGFDDVERRQRKLADYAVVIWSLN